MNFIKAMQIKGKWKKGRIVDFTILPDQQDRDEILVKYAMENNIPIAIGSQERWGALKYTNANVDLVRLAKNFTLDFRGKEFPNGLLIDESIASEMIGWVKSQGIKISGGFKGEEE